MRDWTKLLLCLCVVALGAGMFVLERRISGLEADLRTAQSKLATAATPAPFAISPQTADRVPVQPKIEIVTPADGRTTQRILVAPPVGRAPAQKPQRQPSGEINGVPFYHNLLGQSDR